jgi:hypothetical protein
MHGLSKVKDENIHPIGLLSKFPIPKWKWEIVTIDFITKFPKTIRKHESIMVVVDMLTNNEHLIPVKMTHKETNIAKFYMKEISRLHGVLKAITSKKDSNFTSNVWKWLFK